MPLAVPLLLLLAEGLVRLVTLPVPPALLYYDYFIQLKIQRIKELVATGGPVDLVFFGPSYCMVGIDPDLAAPGLRAYNAGFNRGLSDCQLEFQREVMPILQPRVVVFIMSSTDVNDSSELHADMAAKFAVAAERRAAHARRSSLRRLLDRSALVSRSAELRNPKQLVQRWRAVARKGLAARPDRVAASQLTANGLGTETWNRTYQETERRTEYLAEYIFDDYRSGGPVMDTYLTMLDELQASGAQVKVVFVPMCESYFPMVGGVEVHDHTISQIVGHLADRDVEWLDCTHLCPGFDEFSDQVHLNGAGARRFSGAIRDWLVSQGIVTQGIVARD